MANYVYIEDEQIVEYHDLLPKTWRNVSGLSLASDNEEFLNSLGWYTVNKIPVFYEEGKQYIDGYEYKFENNTVTETAIIKNADIYPEPEPPTSEELFAIKLNEVRLQRDLLLSQSDWTQLADVQSLYSDIWKTNWANYRQQLRDLPNQCDSGQINIYAFEWPTKPQAENIIENAINQNLTNDPNVGE